MTAESPGVNFSLSSLTDFEDEGLARSVLRRLIASPGPFEPKTYGRFEPVDGRIVFRNIDPLVATWLDGDAPQTGLEAREGGLLLRCGVSGGYQVSWQKSREPAFSFVGGDFAARELLRDVSRLTTLWSLVTDLVQIVRPVYGEIRNPATTGWSLPFNLAKRLPDVPWVSIYGPEYVTLFGEHQIRTAPVVRVEELPNGYFWLQLTDSPFDTVGSELREAVRKHLGEDSFMSHGRWRYNDGRAPSFDFSAVTLQ